MKKLLLIILILVLAALAYLFMWPVDVEPVGWNAPDAPKLEGVYAKNEKLAQAERLAHGAGIGPEDVDVDDLGRIYAGYDDGRILRFDNNGKNGELLADTGGRPLGLDFAPDGALVVADAVKGLLAVRKDGSLRTLATEARGVPFKFADDVDVAEDGTIYFSDASSRYGYHEVMYDIMEHGGHGRLLRYEPISEEMTVLLDGLQFANGVAVGPDERYVLVNETGSYRVQRYWLKGPKKGEQEIFIDNLPGFPDGISYDGDGIFWLALYSPRIEMIDDASDKPWLRKLMLRLPEAMSPAPAHHGFVLGLNEQGEVVYNLQGTTQDAYAPITSIEAHEGKLYLGSLTAPAIGRIDSPEPASSPAREMADQADTADPQADEDRPTEATE